MAIDDSADGGDSTAGTELVRRAIAGDDRAFGALYDAWFDRAYARAYGVVRDHAVAAEVTQDTFLTAWQRLGTLRDPAVFGGWLLRIANNSALNRLRSERRTTAVDDVGLAVIERAGRTPAEAAPGLGVDARVRAADDPAAAVEDQEIVALVSDAAAALDGRDAEVLELGLRFGLGPAEIGEAIGLSRNAANQAVHRARRRLRTAVEARVLWRRGRPDCPDLARALAEAGVDRFGAAAVTVTDAHATECTRCAELRRLRLDPAVLFGAIPLVGAPSLLKSEIAHALAGAGVPMRGSAHVDGSESVRGFEPGSDASPPSEPHGATGEASTAGNGPLAASPAPVTARRGRRRALAAAGAVVLVGIVGGGFALLDAPGEGSRAGGPSPVADALASTPTTVAPTTAPPGTAAPVAPPATEPPRVVAPPATGRLPDTVAPTQPPPPPAPTGSISITPSSKSGTWLMSAPDAPRLTWTSENAATVTVEGPGASSTAPNGSVVVCPPVGASGPACPTPPAGTYRYRLTLRDPGGAVVLVREALFTVGP